MKRAALALAAALVLGWPAAASAPAASETWYVIAAQGGAVIGWASHAESDTAQGREIVDVQHITLDQGGAVARIVSRTVRREDASGRTLSLASATQSGPEWSRNDARIAGGRAEIFHRIRAERRRLEVALPADVRFDGGQGLLAAWDPLAQPRLEFDDFDVDAMAVDHVVAEPAPASPSDPPGAIALLRRRYHAGGLIGVSRLVLDPQHRVISATQPMFGVDIVLRLADRGAALAPRPPYRLLPAVMKKSPFRISGPAMTGHIRYRFGFADGLAFAPPRTGEQGVSIDQGQAVVDICEACGPGLAADPAALADALKPTAWLQSDSRRLHAIADPVARLHISDARKMAMLRDFTQGAIRDVDFAGYYSALEALSRHAGDCTETAVLLAALGRAAGIPTRVADGLVYSRERYHGVSNVFMPHSWTLAYVDGRWRSFDAALDGFDNTHIALVVGDGDPRSMSAATQLAGLLVWNDMAEVRTRPAS